MRKDPASEPETFTSSVPEVTESYDCFTEGFWSMEQSSWCCERYNTGCSALLGPTPTENHDCQAGFGTCMKTWPSHKRAWCCMHRHRCCLPPTPAPKSRPTPKPTPPPAAVVKLPPAPPVTSLPFDCNKDYVECYSCLMDRWSAAKKGWCCAHARRGCPTTPLPPAAAANAAKAAALAAGATV